MLAIIFCVSSLPYGGGGGGGEWWLSSFGLNFQGTLELSTKEEFKTSKAIHAFKYLQLL